jgi:hypothetical protein
MLIDASYFNGEISIPNTDQDSVSQNVNWLINKYEPELLQKLFGYSFYKAFINAINVTPPAQPDVRWLNLIYGVEYTSISSNKLESWKGLLISPAQVINFGSGYLYKQPVWIQADVTSGFISGINTATFADWVGWKPIINQPGSVGILQEDVDYTFDSDPESDTAGLLTRTGSNFQPMERFYVSFELKPQNQTDIDNSTKQSLIADYVYYWYQRNSDTSTTGVGENKTSPAGGISVSAGLKAVRAWNEMIDWIYELYNYMQSSLAVYPEYDSSVMSSALCNSFTKINPLF